MPTALRSILSLLLVAPSAGFRCAPAAIRTGYPAAARQPLPPAMEFGKGFGSYYSGWIDFVKEYPQEDRNAYPALFELPKDCYEVKLDKPLGIAFEEGSDGGVVVQYLVEGGNAEQSGVISAGDALLATTACMGRDGTFERKVIPSRFLDFDTIMGEAAARGTAGRVAGAALMPCLWSRCDRLQRAKIQQDEDQRRDPAVCTARRADPPRPARLRPSAIRRPCTVPGAPMENEGDPYDGGSRGVKDYLKSLEFPKDSPWLKR